LQTDYTPNQNDKPTIAIREFLENLQMTSFFSKTVLAIDFLMLEGRNILRFYINVQKNFER